MNRQLRAFALGAMILAALASAGLAAEQEKIRTVKLVLHPAAAPRPALKYQLLPPLIDRRPGNAATQYLKAPHGYTGLYSDNKFWHTVFPWMEMPLPQLRKESREYASLLTKEIGSTPNGLFEQLDMGARCESCDWALPIRQDDYDQIVLPEIQSIRQPARFLTVRARLQIADGKFDEAIRTLQTGFAMSRHVAQGPYFVQSLIGAAISGLMSVQVEAWVEQPGAPNLYWALASLPRPMVDYRPAIEGELAKAYLAHPELQDLDKKHYPPEQWQQLLRETADRWAYLTRFGREVWDHPPTEAQRRETLKMLLDLYPEAKKSLIAKGRSPAEVDAMPTAQAVLLYATDTYDEVRDDLYKWFWMPYPESRKRLEQAATQPGSSGSGGAIFSPLVTYAKGLLIVPRASAGIDRNIAALEILEAIRLYGASHEGRLPQSLADITEVSIPPDPLRGEPFLYRREGSTGILESPSPEYMTLRYEIQFARDVVNP